MSTPERGLEPLLDVWPAIQEKVPHATLHLYSSFKGWLMSDEDNQKMSWQLYDRIDKMQGEGAAIINHVHANAEELRQALFTSELFLYPTRWFNETNCMCALEAAAAGLPAVVTGKAALLERVAHGENGYIVVDDGQHAHDQMFVKYATDLLTDSEMWHRMSDRAIDVARLCDYKELVESWEQRWTYEITARR